MTPERVQVWLLEPAAPAAVAASERCTQCILAPAARPYRDTAWAALSRGGFLLIALLLPLTIPALAVLQESPRATHTARSSPNHHTRLVTSGSPRTHDAQLARGRRVPRFQAVQIRQILPHAHARLPQGLRHHQQRPSESQLPRDAVYPAGFRHTRGRWCIQGLVPASTLRLWGRAAGAEFHRAPWCVLWLRLGRESKRLGAILWTGGPHSAIQLKPNLFCPALLPHGRVGNLTPGFLTLNAFSSQLFYSCFFLCETLQFAQFIQMNMSCAMESWPGPSLPCCYVTPWLSGFWCRWVTVALHLCS